MAETDAPGVFKLWALVGSELHAVKVNVPRIFYVNCKAAREGEGTSKTIIKLLKTFVSCHVTQLLKQLHWIPINLGSLSIFCSSH